LSRIVISADSVVGGPPHVAAECRWVWAALSRISAGSGVGNGREDGTVPGKHSDLFLSISRQRETVAVSCDYGPDEGWREARSTDRRVWHDGDG
jgi:hypothetical protein